MQQDFEEITPKIYPPAHYPVSMQIDMKKEPVRTHKKNHFYTRVRINGKWVTRSKPKR